MNKPALFSSARIALAILWSATSLFSPKLVTAQQSSAQGGVGIVSDWTSKHLIFRDDSSPEAARAIASDPRLRSEWLKKEITQQRFHLTNNGTLRMKPRDPHHIDWAISLGATGGMPVGEQPAKYNFSYGGNITTANCSSDFVVMTITAAPSSSQANIVAFNNLYTGASSSFCPYGVQSPVTTDYKQATFMWSYAAGTSLSNLSPALSYDGKKVAFIEASTGASFDVLTWVAGQGTDATHPATPGSGGSSLVRLDYTNITTAGCTASKNTDSNASPFVDYNSDAAYLTADNGNLYRVTGVFKGTPTLQYCINVAPAGTLMNSPVYDVFNNMVYVTGGDYIYAYSVGASGFTLVSSLQVASTSATNPMIITPIVDVTNGFIYLYTGSDLTNTYSAVSQVKLDLSSQAVAHIGKPAVQPASFLFYGDFDNTYYTVGPKGGLGTLYVCGTDATNGAKPSLYALGFTAPNGILNPTPLMSDNRNINNSGNSNGTCSPITEAYDGTTDRIFVSTGQWHATAGANMVTEWNINTPLTLNTTAPNNTATNYYGGTSGLAIDNFSNAPQAMSVYFGTLAPTPLLSTAGCGTGNYCAVKLTQSGLQ